ncbi:Fur family transcriptional regulator [Aquibacillus salsiterrae]|uniref:Transcriptional repressor n=1 Tax=Aquibacillus salsiterrae TaxID=2950439 RepID=A0A9X3WAT0_9BACI|nr:Fur family transcriptional regulator [Aquibacillus salsiterrae]MDC3415910.1 transcriptional repressor [Aquibacillus salsiterrae]
MSQSEVKKDMLGAMRTKGWRITDQRKELARLFSNKDYLTPMNVYEEMSKKFANISFNTVYRNLNRLLDIGVLEQFHFPDGVKFKMCHLSSHHHHAICLECKKTIPLEFCPMDITPSLPKTFKVDSHHFEIYGYCKDCRS